MGPKAPGLTNVLPDPLPAAPLPRPLGVPAEVSPRPVPSEYPESLTGPP